ncbi:MAG: hypothetical protein HY317_03210 [Acidobacteria bacterium]|nr:hypothetical protein [Acidobacteriota bacterium]
MTRMTDRLLTSAIVRLLRLVRRLSLARSRRPGEPWPGRAHALVCAGLLALGEERRP